MPKTLEGDAMCWDGEALDGTYEEVGQAIAGGVDEIRLRLKRGVFEGGRLTGYRCIRCEEEKPLEAFAADSRNKYTRRQNTCRVCRKEHYEAQKAEKRLGHQQYRKVSVTCRMTQEYKSLLRAYADEKFVRIGQAAHDILVDFLDEWKEMNKDSDGPALQRPLSGERKRRPVEEAEAEAAALVKRLAPARGSGGG